MRGSSPVPLTPKSFSWPTSDMNIGTGFKDYTETHLSLSVSKKAKNKKNSLFKNIYQCNADITMLLKAGPDWAIEGLSLLCLEY